MDFSGCSGFCPATPGANHFLASSLVTILGSTASNPSHSLTDSLVAVPGSVPLPLNPATHWQTAWWPKRVQSHHPWSRPLADWEPGGHTGLSPATSDPSHSLLRAWRPYWAQSCCLWYRQLAHWEPSYRNKLMMPLLARAGLANISLFLWDNWEIWCIFFYPRIQ